MVIVGSGTMNICTEKEAAKTLHEHLESERYVRKPFVIENTYEDFYKPKEWVCKGKHQYRHTATEIKDGIAIKKWTCQCGKTL